MHFSPHYFKQNYHQRSAITFLLALVAIVLLLKIEVDMTTHWEMPELKTLRISFSKAQKPTKPEEQTESVNAVATQPKNTKTLAEKPLEHLSGTPSETLSEAPTNKPPKIQPKTKAENTESSQKSEPKRQKPTVLPSSGQILNSFYSGASKNQEVSDDFKAFKESSDDFIYFEVEEPDWNKVVKLINEEIDKPRTQMKFYSNGIEGKFERLMDKITYTKTFKTKYGTKVTCGLVGVFVACGWK